MSVLPDVERRDRDRDRVRSLGGQIADEGDISELDQRVRYIHMYAGVGEVGSESCQCIGCCVSYLGEQLWANVFEGFQVATNLAQLVCLQVDVCSVACPPTLQVCCAA